MMNPVFNVITLLEKKTNVRCYRWNTNNGFLLEIILTFIHLFDRFLQMYSCLLYTSPSPRDATLSRMPSSA